MSPQRCGSSNPAEIYEQYFVPAISRPWAHVLFQHATPRAGERVLDVACGTGIVARHVAPVVGTPGRVAALDLNPAMLAVACSLPQPNGAAIEWQEGSAVALPFPDDSFDLILCQQGLQFFPDRPVALREMRRVLGPVGRVALSVWQSLEHNPVNQAVNEAAVRHLGTPAIGIGFALGDAEKLRGLLTEAGFQQVTITPVELTVQFPSAHRFVELSVLAAAAVLPTFAQMDASARAGLIDTVSREVDAPLRAYTKGDILAFPMAAYIAVART